MQEEQGNTTTTPGDSRSPSFTSMEESIPIEPLTDDDDDVLLADNDNDGGSSSRHDTTSDYDSGEEETRFGSVTSSVGGHVWEYGRRYHAFRYGRYYLPNDEGEANRESLRHEMLKDLLGGKLYAAPIGSNPQKIIDLGTGFGEWAIEMGEEFPSAKVIGVDLSPIQPHWIPPNVEFIVDDIEDEWAHASDFDYAHFRFVNTTLRDNEGVLRKVFQNLKPGGWIEIQDILPRTASDDDTIPAHYAIRRFYSMIEPVVRERYGADLYLMDRMPQLLESTGFTNVQRRVFHIPLGEWPRDRHLRLIGALFRETVKEFVDAMAAKPLVEAGYERDEIDELLKDVAEDLGNRRIHAYVPIHFVWAQKPLVGT
ncbi:hypothetical protein VTJ04DRAFT_4438 [Mycothermus thermophilus]|uniref:uncharacterized protein n=1 Tax=Humicola insolens TaxID=85995 RepID=UPI0037420362